MTVQQLCDNLSSYELTEWAAFLKIEAEEIEKANKKAQKRPQSNPPKEVRPSFHP